MKRHRYFPCALNVENKPCLVIGNDDEAIEKSIRLADAKAKLTLITQGLPSETLADLKSHGVVISEKVFELSDLEGQFFVVFCPKDQPSVAKEVYLACVQKRILLCAIDQPEYCDIVNVSIFERGDLRMTISTNGIAPSLAKKIRQSLEASMKDLPVEDYLEELATLRARYEKEISDPKERRAKLIAAVKDFQMKIEVQFPLKK